VQHCLSWIGSPEYGAAGFASGDASKSSGVGLRRTVVDRKVFGVCGGLARSVGLDPTIVRVTFALATVFTAIVPGIIAYLVMTFAIPSEDDPRGMV